MQGLEVTASGILSLIQDPGRFGVAHLGLSSGGPADTQAFCWANYILGNPMSAPQIEITIGKAAFTAGCDMQLALTGADMQASVDGEYQPNWRTFLLRKGQTLSFAYARHGMRAYLAVRGGFSFPLAFGSCATVMRNQLGGINSGLEAEEGGKALKKGDCLPIAHQSVDDYRVQYVPRSYIPEYGTHMRIGVIESYQCDVFDQTAKSAFYQEPYRVSNNSDRMGIRLQGPEIHAGVSGIISEGIAPGSIQVPPNGQPIILMQDRQTLGGYPKLGCVTRRSLSLLAQARPDTQLQFYPANLKEESVKWAAFCRFFQ